MRKVKAKAIRKAAAEFLASKNLAPASDRKYIEIVIKNPIGLNKKTIVNHPYSLRAMYKQAKKQLG